MSNISEGFSRETDKEFIRFLTISKASASEVQSQLYIALDQNYIDKKTFDGLYEMLDHCSRQIANLILYLKGTPKADPKDA
jgi:four helix bundle protein